MTSRDVAAAVTTLRDAQWSSEHFDVTYLPVECTDARTDAPRDVAAAATILRYAHWSPEHFDVRYIKIGLKMVKLQQFGQTPAERPPNPGQTPAKRLLSDCQMFGLVF